MGRIENDHQLQVSREAVEGLRRALKHAQRIPQPEIRKDCSDNLYIWINRIRTGNRRVSGAGNSD